LASLPAPIIHRAFGDLTSTVLVLESQLFFGKDLQIPSNAAQKLKAKVGE
jgi:hypothetical protein